MKNYTLLSILLIFTIFLAGCSLFGRDTSNLVVGEFQDVRRTFFPMDTILDVVVQTTDPAHANKAIENAYTEIQRLEQMLSATIETSEISKINENAGVTPVKVSPETFDLLELGLKYAELTHGKFDITIKPLLDVYDWREGERTEALPDEELVSAAKELVNYKELVLDKDNMTAYLKRPQMKIDLGGIAKGYIIDRAVDILIESGLEHGYINGGGDIRFLGPKHDGEPWRIGIKNPRGQENLGVVNVMKDSIVSSGDYERYFITSDGIRVHHIIDPHTGISANYAQSVTVIAENATIADILSTSLFMFPTHEAIQLAKDLQVEVIIITGDGEIVMTEGMEGITTLVN